MRATANPLLPAQLSWLSRRIACCLALAALVVAGSAWRTQAQANRARAAPCHRHAWRACVAARISPVCPMPNPAPRRAAAWFRACSAPSTASIRLSSKASRCHPSAAMWSRALMARGFDEPSRFTGLLRRSVETDAEAQLRHFPAQSSRSVLRWHSRSRRRMSFSPGSSCAIKDGQIIAPTTRRSQGRSRSASGRCASISPAAMTASFRSSSA